MLVNIIYEILTMFVKGNTDRDAGLISKNYYVNETTLTSTLHFR